ncbi:Cof-type HAD-IIB family hydrolase [[Acholeplasma] multilocale]|uniref:Cof-type HAD-IIB family hydrolase n=1 Tax=[Acholeplasma] multilocale TaxID=264638 RepID=UPI00054DEF8C|nr:Cof-type HAD-IIB family hydrolase [[Acholeplasma] multilocale]
MAKLNNIKLVITDLDGTVLQHGQLSNPADQEALLKLNEKGIGVTIATGQTYSSAKPRADFFGIENNLDYIVLANGAMISKVSEFKPLYVSNIEHDIVKKVYDKCTEMDICWLAFYTTNQHVYWNGSELTAKSMVDRNWISKYIVHDISDEVDFRFDNVIQMMIFVPDEQEPELLKWFEDENLSKVINSMRSNVESMPIYEYTNVEATKGDTIIKLAEMLNIDINDVVVFGDNMNDLSMFEKIPNCVAVGNAVEPIKKLAKYITDTNLNGGVGKFINEYILEEGNN